MKIYIPYILKNDTERFEEFYNKTLKLSEEYGYSQFIICVADPVDGKNSNFYAKQTASTEGTIKLLEETISWMKNNVED